MAPSMDEHTMNRIEWALTSRHPNLFDIMRDADYRNSPKDFKDLVDERCTFTYYSPNRPLAFSGLVSPSQGFTCGRLAFTFDLLPLDLMVSLELLPVGHATAGAVAQDFYHQAYGNTGAYLLYKESGANWFFSVVHPSTNTEYPDKWQVTHFDEHGPTGHHYADTIVDALGEEILSGYRPVPPDSMDGIEFTPLTPAI